MPTLRPGLALAGCLLTLPLLTGCPAMNTYGTARTTPKGKISHSLSEEGYGFSTKVTTTDSSGATTESTVGGFVPLILPSYHLRWGVADQVDLGFHVNNLASLGADAKINLLKGRVDLAVDPGVQWFSLSVGTQDNKESLNVFYLHGPLLVDFNVNETLSFVLTPGMMYTYVTSQLTSGSDAELATTTDGVYARFGLGINIRASKKFAVHPEVTVLRNFGDTETLLYMAGIGFNFGHLPSFDDLGGGGED